MTRSRHAFALRSLPVVPAAATLVALSAAATLVTGCSVRPSQAADQSRAAPPAVSVKTAPAVARTVPRTITLTGSLTANREAAVAADVTGKVAQVFVERGSEVRMGAPLVRLDRRMAALSEAESRSNAAAAISQSALANAECQRAQKLFADDAINQAEYDRAITQCQSTALQARAALMRQQMAGKTLVDQIIRAPFDGVVGERFVNPGEYVRPDSRVVALVQMHPLRLELSVPEQALAAFGMGAEVEFQVTAYPRERFTGKVRYVGATVRRATRDLLVEAVVDNRGQRLRPGMFAVAEVKLGEDRFPVVPLGALRTDELAGTDRVFVVRAGKIQERLVHKGAVHDGGVAIRAGIDAGDQVVLSPAPGLKDGQRVQ